LSNREASVIKQRFLIAMVAALASAVVSLAATQAESYKINERTSKIEFIGTKDNGKHTGAFEKFSGTIEVDGETLEKIELTIETKSLKADDRKLTGHLQSPDFFDVKKFPKASFKSKEVKSSAAGKVEIDGELTLHGVTKPIRFPATIKSEGSNVSVEGKYKMNRHDFGISYGKGKVHDEVPITFVIKASK
jgi:polyisoprenoid-binding protein YceI